MYLLSLLLIFTFNVSANEIGPKELVVSTQEWPPYHYAKNGEVHGKAVDAIDCILTKMNQKYQIKILPWMRAQINTKQGQSDAFFSASHSEKRDKFAIQSNVFIGQNWNFYFLKKTKDVTSKENIKQEHIVGTRINSNVLNWLTVNGFKTAARYSQSNKLIELLVNSRVKVVMENDEVFKHSVKELNLSMNLFNSIHNKSHHLGVYFGKKFTKKYPLFLTEFNKHSSKCSLIK